MKYLNTFESYNGEAEMDEGLFSFIGTLFSNPKKKRELDKLAEELFRTRVEIGKLKLEGDPIEELEAELADKSNDFTTSSTYDSKESTHDVKIELLETKEEEIVARMDEIGEENEKLAKYVSKVKLESRMRSTEALMRVADTEVKKVLNKLRQKDQQSIKKADKELIQMKESQMFEAEETYKDYPAAAKANAKKAIDWKEKHGRDEVKGGTAVGWQRAHQLAKGEALSRDVVSRMAQFNRHRKNSGIAPEHKDEPWKDNGHIAWLIWGGDEGVDWAMKKMDQIKKEEANESTKTMKHVKLFEQFVNESDAYLLSMLADKTGTGPAEEFLKNNKIDLEATKKAIQQGVINKYDLRDVVKGTAAKSITKKVMKEISESVVNEAKGKDLIKVQKLDWTDHTRLIKWLSTEMNKKVNLEVIKTGGYTIDPSNLDDEEVEALMSYLKSQRYLV